MAWRGPIALCEPCQASAACPEGREAIRPADGSEGIRPATDRSTRVKWPLDVTGEGELAPLAAPGDDYGKRGPRPRPPAPRRPLLLHCYFSRPAAAGQR